MNTKSPRIAGQIALLALVLLPAIALAQSNQNSMQAFDPSQKDMTRWIISSIFGDWKSSTEVPILGGAMRVFNMFALAFGTLMFTYVTIIGTMNTAQDGELLGKKWSSMWVPVRFTAGTALLVPMASGYSTIQHFILWLALAGGGAASQVWAAATASLVGNMQTQVIDSPEFDSKVRILMRDILKAEYCTAKQGAVTSEAFGLDPSAKQASLADPNMGQINSYSRSIRWGALSDSSGQPADACGSAKTSTFTDLNGQSFQLSPATPTGLNNQYINGAGFDDQAGAAKMNVLGHKVVDDQIGGMLLAATQLRPLAQKMATATTLQGMDAEIIAAIQSASAVYKATVKPSVKAAADGFDTRLTKFTDASRDAGWLMAGSTFFQMAQIKSSAGKMMHQLPTMAAGQALTDPIAGVADVASSMDMAAMETMIDKNFKGDATDWANPGQMFVGIFNKVFGYNPNSPSHALVQIKDTGDWIIVGSETAAAGFLAFQTTNIVAGNTGIGRIVDLGAGVSSSIKEITSMLGPAIYGGFIGAFGLGITMAFVLPLLPFTLTLGSIVGWLMALFSAVVAGPIWLAGHLHPEGDDLAGKGVGGYMILLETVTRPIFIIFGLIGAFLIMDPLLRLIHLMFTAAMSSLQGNSTTGIVSIAVLAMLYVGITFTTVRSIMSLVHVLSETVYRWIGGAHAGMEQAREFNQEARSGAEVATKHLQGTGATIAHARRKSKGLLDDKKPQGGWEGG
ncbi:conjugal transfer/type IV secretion protein DotA/TraY [Roseateles asaccharophilus]|uniref:DotA/TraY family protein n=1 Tax=Roseateles asaccharophilus TaxID=582607 RepID=UPI0038383C4A